MAVNHLQCNPQAFSLDAFGLDLPNPSAAIADAFSNSNVYTIWFCFKLVSVNFNLNMDVCWVGLTKNTIICDINRPSMARIEEFIGRF